MLLRGVVREAVRVLACRSTVEHAAAARVDRVHLARVRRGCIDAVQLRHSDHAVHARRGDRADDAPLREVEDEQLARVHVRDVEPVRPSGRCSCSRTHAGPGSGTRATGCNGSAELPSASVAAAVRARKARSRTLSPASQYANSAAQRLPVPATRVDRDVAQRRRRQHGRIRDDRVDTRDRALVLPGCRRRSRTRSSSTRRRGSAAPTRSDDDSQRLRILRRPEEVQAPSRDATSGRAELVPRTDAGGGERPARRAPAPPPQPFPPSRARRPR